MKLSVSDIRMDGGTQPRSVIDPDVIEAYYEDMLSGAKFPPVDVFYDGSEYWLADGFHRCRAAEAADILVIEATVHQGTVDDARWFSFGVNQAHGVRRTNQDKQRAVQAALAHPKSAGLSDNEIARHVGVSQPTVSAWREKTGASSKTLKMETRTATRNGKQYQIEVTNIGKKVAATPAAHTTYTPDPDWCEPCDPAFDPLAESWVSTIIKSCREIISCECLARDLAATINERKDRDEVYRAINNAIETLSDISAKNER